MTRETAGDMAGCANPIDAAVLADYWLAALPAPAEESVEEHLLACDQCGARLREVIALGDAIRLLARQGTLQMVVSDAFVDRATEDGLTVRAYAPAPGGSVQCTVTDEDDLMIARLAANLSGVTRLDLAWCDARGVEYRRVQDIPFRAGGSHVVWQESLDLMKASKTTTQIARLLTIDDAGTERLLGEFTFNHTRTLPGMGTWPPD